MSILLSLLYWAFTGLSSGLLFFGALAIWLVTAPFERSRSLLHRYTCCWAQLYLRCLPHCRLQVQGREKIMPDTPYILVANHQSAADILALSFLEIPFKWLSLRRNFWVPFVGWNMSLNGYVAVEPGNPDSVRAALQRCRYWLEQGVPVLWFPEGRRSYTGQIRTFRGGAFRLAAEFGCAVVPIVVDGTAGVFRGWKIADTPINIRVRILDPISVVDPHVQAERLRDQAHARIQAGLVTMR
jgi:1-acyl-sn-glycerol-3-phosphate acyltransferase